MAAPLYAVVGPVPAQDGRAVWQVVRAVEGRPRPWPLLECLSERVARRECDEMNTAPQPGA